MKIRSYFKNRKINYSRTLTPEKIHIRVQEKQSGPPVDDQPNCEQMACCELIEQSWKNGSEWLEGREELDAFLRITPRSKRVEKMANKNNFDHLSLSDIKLEKNKKSSNSNPIKKYAKTQQSPQIHNSFACPQRLPLPLNSHLFVGKEVLNLTQYIITGPKWQFGSTSSIDCTRKLEKNKYIRVLKQMRNRNRRIASQREQKHEKVKENLSQINNFITEKQRDMDRIFISSQRVMKDRRAYSLRKSQNINHSFSPNHKGQKGI